jgi:hypothetical protein
MVLTNLTHCTCDIILYIFFEQPNLKEERTKISQPSDELHNLKCPW